MTNANDDVIMGLKEAIEKKKVELGANQRFVPATNCSLDLDGVRYNLHVLDNLNLIHLMAKLLAYKRESDAMDLTDQYTISGFNITEWISDIDAKRKIANRKAEEDKLKAMEKRLNQLLSADKQTEIEIELLKKMLG